MDNEKKMEEKINNLSEKLDALLKKMGENNNAKMLPGSNGIVKKEKTSPVIVLTVIEEILKKEKPAVFRARDLAQYLNIKFGDDTFTVKAISGFLVKQGRIGSLRNGILIKSHKYFGENSTNLFYTASYGNDGGDISDYTLFVLKKMRLMEKLLDKKEIKIDKSRQLR